MLKKAMLAVLVLALAVPVAACGGDDEASGGSGSSQELVIYSGRNKDLVGPVIERFRKQSGIDVKVRYSDTADLAATLLEEGERSPADVFFAQDAGALGAVQKEGLFARLPQRTLDAVPQQFRSDAGQWVGVTGRARVVAYDKRELEPAELPNSILDYTDEQWKGRIGWAPTNASFQAFVTALRVTEGEETARRWLEGIVANEATVYPNNIAVRDAIANGEVDVGFINHYYVAEAIAEEGSGYPVAVDFPGGGDPGSLVNVAGVGIVQGADHPQAAQRFVDFLLSEQGQRFFRDETKEYPLAAGVQPDESLRPLDEIEQPDIDLSDIDDLQGTLELLRETGAL